MQSHRRFVTAGAVFLIAFSTGFVMQNADVLAARIGLLERPADVIETAVNTDLVPPEPAVPHLSEPATQRYAARLLPDA